MICAIAICIIGDTLYVSARYCMKSTYGFNNSINNNAPITLNNTLKKALRFAARLPPIEANTAVTVVPMLLPNTNGSAAAKVIAPES